MSIILNGSTGLVTNVTLPAGTTSLAPMTFTSGTNLTSATAGAMEYDGKVPYFTPQGSQRGCIPGMQYYQLTSGLLGANSNAAQSFFGVGCTLSSNTVYEFEAVYGWTKTAGTTSHTVNLLFGGTATINSIYYAGNTGAVSSSTGTFLDTSANMFGTNVVTSTPSSGPNTAAAQSRGTVMRGSVSVNAGGTFIPQYQLSAAPGGAYTILAGSYFLIYPIGTAGANVSVGTWA